MITGCPDPNKAGCPYIGRKGSCRANTHHLYFPARNYKSPVQNAFRELLENKVQLCMFEHQTLHETEFPPRKPSLPDMLSALSQQAIEETDREAA